jgi:ribosome-associated protein
MSDEHLPKHVALRLDQFLQISGIAGTGGQAKLLIQGGEVLVNGELETKRRRKLGDGDAVQFGGCDYPIKEYLSDS